MRGGARTPEELETLFEDAFVIRDGAGLARLFVSGAVLIAGDGLPEARGGNEIAGLALTMWERDQGYVADPRRILQARDTALVMSERSLNVARRGGDGTWRYAISLLFLDDSTAIRP